MKLTINEFLKHEIKCTRIDKETNNKIKNLSADEYIKAYDKAEKTEYTSYVILFRGKPILSINSDCTDYDPIEQYNLAFKYIKDFGNTEVENLDKNLRKKLNNIIMACRKDF